MDTEKIIINKKCIAKVDYFLDNLPQVLCTEDGKEIRFGNIGGFWGYNYEGCTIIGHQEAAAFNIKDIVVFLQDWINKNRIN